MRIAYLALVEIDIANACLIHTRETAEQLAAMGHDVTVILPRPLRMQAWAGVTHAWARWWGFDHARQLAFFAVSAWLLIRRHRRHAFDVLYVREVVRHPFLAPLVRWLRLPLIVEVNGWMLDDFRLAGAPDRVLRAIGRAQRNLLRAAAGIIVSTTGNAERIISRYGIPPERVLVQELGTNTEQFSPGNQRQARNVLGLHPEARVILFAGSFHPHHDLATVVRAFGRLALEDTELTLLLVGHGATWSMVRTQGDSLGLAGRIHMPGSRPYEEMPVYFRAADVAVLPLTEANIRQRNGCITLKLWDYMAAGLPVLVTDLADTPSARLLGTMVCRVPPEDPEAMAKALRDLLADPARRSALAGAGLDYVRKHRTWRQAAEDTVRFMQARLGSA